MQFNYHRRNFSASERGHCPGSCPGMWSDYPAFVYVNYVIYTWNFVILITSHCRPLLFIKKTLIKTGHHDY